MKIKGAKRIRGFLSELLGHVGELLLILVLFVLLVNINIIQTPDIWIHGYSIHHTLFIFISTGLVVFAICWGADWLYISLKSPEDEGRTSEFVLRQPTLDAEQAEAMVEEIQVNLTELARFPEVDSIRELIAASVLGTSAAALPRTEAPTYIEVPINRARPANLRLLQRFYPLRMAIASVLVIILSIIIVIW